MSQPILNRPANEPHSTKKPSWDEQTRVYQDTRFECFSAFDDACRELVTCLKSLIGEAHSLAAALPQDPTGADSPDQFSLNTLLKGIHTNQAICTLATITNERLPTPDPERLEDLQSLDSDCADALARIPPQAIAEANRSLVSQLNAILDAALYYTAVDDDIGRLVLENNLVRAGADLRDVLAMRLEPQSSHLRFTSAAFNFVVAYEGVLLTYDVMAKLKKPSEGEFDESSWSKTLALAKVFREAARRSPTVAARSMHGLAFQLAAYQEYDRITFQRLLDLAENRSSFEDVNAVPLFRLLVSWLEESPDRGSIQPFRSDQERNEFHQLLQPLSIANPLRGVDNARNALTAVAFQNEAGFDPRLLRWVSLAENAIAEDADLELLERAVLRGVCDPGRCGWLAVASLYLLRQRQDWEWREGFALNPDPVLTRVFQAAHRLYDKLVTCNYHPRATNLRMALLWNLVYDPALTADPPFELNSNDARAATLLDDASNSTAAFVSERFQFHGSSDLQSLSSLYLVGRYHPTLASGLIRWSSKITGRSLGDPQSRYQRVAELIRNLEGISASGNWSAAAARTRQISYVRGTFCGVYSRAVDLEERLLEALPPVESYLAELVRALRSLAAMSGDQIRAHQQLIRLLPRLNETLSKHFVSGDPTELETGFQAMEDLICSDDARSEHNVPLPVLRAQLASHLYDKSPAIAVRCEGEQLVADDLRRLYWFRRYTGLETLQFGVRNGEQYLWIDALRLDGGLIFDSQKKWSDAPLPALDSRKLDDLGDRLLTDENNPWRGVYCNERPWRIVSEAETTFSLIAWCLLNASKRLKRKSSVISDWLDGGIAIPCLPTERRSWREATVSQFLREFGFQSDNGKPTERLLAFLDWSLEEGHCLSKGSLPCKERDLWVGAPRFPFKRFHAALWPSRFAWHRESALNVDQTTSTAGRLAVKAIWELIQEAVEKERSDAGSLLDQLEAHKPFADFREEFAYRRFREMPVALIATPLLAGSERPLLFAMFRMSGLFLTSEYRRRAWRGEYGDWFRFGHSVSSTYRLSAERLAAIQRVLDVLAPIALEAHQAAASSS